MITAQPRRDTLAAKFAAEIVEHFRDKALDFRAKLISEYKSEKVRPEDFLEEDSDKRLPKKEIYKGFYFSAISSCLCEIGATESCTIAQKACESIMYTENLITMDDKQLRDHAYDAAGEALKDIISEIPISADLKVGRQKEGRNSVASLIEALAQGHTTTPVSAALG